LALETLLFCSFSIEKETEQNTPKQGFKVSLFGFGVRAEQFDVVEKTPNCSGLFVRLPNRSEFRLYCSTCFGAVPG
jgi:hypothetical protein